MDLADDDFLVHLSKASAAWDGLYFNQYAGILRGALASAYDANRNAVIVFRPF